MYQHGQQAGYGYGAPQQVQLPPMDRLVVPFIALQQGVPPNLPIRAMVPPSMQQLYPTVLYIAIDMIQREAPVNELRRLHFNIIAQNSFVNPEFTQFVNKLVELSEMLLILHPQVAPDQLITEAAFKYTQFKVAEQMFKIPGLQQIFNDAGFIGACQQTCNEFLHWVKQMEMNMPRQQQYGYVGGQQGGQQQQYAHPQGGGAMMPTNRPHSMVATRFGGGNSLTSELSGGANMPQQPVQVEDSLTGWRRANRGPATPSISTMMQGRRDVVIPDITPEIVTIGKSTTTTTTTASVSKVETIEAAIPETPHLSVAPAVQPVPAPTVAQATATPVAAAQPKQYVHIPKIAYDPNRFEQIQFEMEGGAIATRLKDKQMDREAHLGKPHHAPAWVKPPTLAEFEQRIEKARAEDPKGEMVELIEVNGGITPAMNARELWAKADQAIANYKRKKPKVVVATVGGMIIKPFPATKAVIDFLDSVAATKDLRKAAEMMRIQAAIYANQELVVLMEANHRLTARVNRMISKEMSLSSGTMSDFMNDIDEVIEYLSTEFSEEVATIFKAAGPQMLVESLHTLDITAPTYANLIDAYYDDDVLVADGEQNPVAMFIDDVLLAATDFTSVDLSLELPSGKQSALLLERAAPLAYEIIEKMLSSQFTETARRFLLRCSDGVVIQVDKGAFDPNARMVSVASMA